MSQELLDTLERINANANRLVAAVRSDQWEASTPCTEWTVRDLVNHMAGSTKLFQASASRSPWSSPPDADHLGDDPAGSFAAATAATMAAWRADGALESMVSTPAEMPAVAALGVNVIDIGTHCWDLAMAIGADHGLSDQTIAIVDRWNRQIIDEDIRAGAGFGEALDADGADGLTAMLAFVGRRG